jgi:hypothetical protein
MDTHLKTDSDRIALYVVMYQTITARGLEATQSGQS